MKNEVLVKAITEIDDELILSAHSPVIFKRKVMKCFGACAAACLVFVCAVVLLSHINSEPEILINGASVSSQPITVISSNTRQIAADDIAVPIEIVSKGKLTVTAVDGSLEVYSSKTYEQIFAGKNCEVKGSVAVQWIIENPDRNQTYKIQVNNQETVFILKYEQTTNEWIITK